jgi:hypothetical protein
MKSDAGRLFAVEMNTLAYVGEQTGDTVRTGGDAVTVAGLGCPAWHPNRYLHGSLAARGGRQGNIRRRRMSAQELAENLRQTAEARLLGHRRELIVGNTSP